MSQPQQTQELAPSKPEPMEQDANSSEEKKAKRKKLWKLAPEDCIFAKFTNVDDAFMKNIQDQMKDVEVQSEYKGADIEIISPNRIKVYPSIQEIRKMRNEKRRLYTQSQAFIQKHNSETAKQKRREYNSQENVKMRKSLRQAAKNMFTKEFKLKDPDAYNRLIEEKMKEIEELRKQKKQKLNDGTARAAKNSEQTSSQSSPEKDEPKPSQPSQQQPTAPTRKRKRAPNDTTTTH